MASKLQIVIALGCIGGAIPAYAQWVNFVDETSTRLIGLPGLGADDTEEKDFAWADLDLDGDIDLVNVRKQPFTSTGKRVNVLFMNEGTAEGHSFNGILVDRTADYALDSDVVGDNGFQTATNDRDVAIVDVNGDDWPDLITATTLTDNQAKHLSHPRVYINKGEQAGIWQGFEYQDARIPLMHATAGPRFCSVAAGDLTGNGKPDLYFGDYDSGGSQIYDYNNKLLINDGAGFFSDQTDTRLTTEMALSAFGAATVIEDFNGDGALDVLKQTSLSSPTHVAVTYNGTGVGEGHFNTAGSYDTIYSVSPYFVSVDDLNNDGLLDIVITDDGNDRYLLNQGNGGNGEVNWSSPFSFGSPSAGFGGNSWNADLNNDGFSDVLITDVDVDIPGCNRRMHIYRNLGNVPNVSFQEQGEIIPNSLLNGTHDVAVFDINQDGWLDLVVGRCSDTRIWMNVPPEGMQFSYPAGLPLFTSPENSATVQVLVTPTGTGELEADSGQALVSVEGGAYSAVPMTLVSSGGGGDLYEAVLPAAACPSELRYYFTAELTNGSEFVDPPGAPATGTHKTFAAEGFDVTLRDEIEGDVSGWNIIDGAGVTSGTWEAVDPNGTSSGSNAAAPENDATAGEAVKCFVTENGLPGGGEFVNDVDGGAVYLESPLINLLGTDATISYSRWFYTEFGIPDQMRVEISATGGGPWLPVTTQTTSGTGSEWEGAAFIVSDWVIPSENIRVRFIIEDLDASLTEGGIDNFQIEEFICPAEACVEDLDGSGDVGFGDILEVIANWGCTTCPDEDLNGNGTVDFADILSIIGAFGPCS
ncbi:MAG: hypothetical protein GY715_03205 [Planctomycetes bacterium]|nr:hypothetical protein [Planctomycetota bacterium]